MALASPTETRRIGRYILGPEVAAGAASVVHLGLLDGAEGFRRAVAIKRLRADHRSPRGFSALRREALISSSVRHPNIVAVLDLVHEAGELLVVMEYLTGDHLAQLLTMVAPLPAEIAVRIALDLLSALNAVHSARSTSGQLLRLVHRDVSPQNILVAVDGVARLTDFGVARCLSDDAITVVGAVKGATGYVAPELASGGPIDARSDLFSVAVVLWEMLTGKRLFKHVIAADALVHAMERGITPPSHLNHRVPTRLDDVLLRALSAAADDRQHSARAFSVDLASALNAASHEEVADFLRVHLRKSFAIQEAQLRALRAARPTLQLTAPSALVAGAAGQPVIVERAARLTSPPTELPVVRAPSWRSARALAAGQMGRKRAWASFGFGLVVSIGSLFWCARNRPLPAAEPKEEFPALAASSSNEAPVLPRATSPSATEAQAPSLEARPAAAVGSVADLPLAPPLLPRSAPTKQRRSRSWQVTRAPSKVATAAPKQAVAVSSPCAVPFIVDALGIKRVRRECFSVNPPSPTAGE